MKTNEIRRENLMVKPESIEPVQKRMVVEKPEIKKDTLHISESKRESNVLDNKITDISPTPKVAKTTLNQEQQLDNLLKKLNVNTDIINKGIRFEKDNYYDKMIVRVYNRETGDIIKQIPPQDMLEFAKKSEEITGILFDKTV
ncbi:MAG: flagellar protein FlaG [Fusobacteriaceae bacterium]|jgi:flagellar protein FlaG|nr:flagellar protein FlaG [Fusobacteriaceae bacterium]MBP6467989.1 flagellar protein FlaG [Fusobacteriaceae bacterium]MBP9595953.1 flagellar protein FlaG [Fusobacteriaceae bacterium]MBU9917868.1 flagellar protein FlaG [Fusobacteriaceae bacterium]